MVKRYVQILWMLGLLLVSSGSLAVVELHEFSSEQIRDRYDGLIEELRCPKCQNQNLAGSDSEVSADLRREVLIMLENGNSDDEIRRFMRDRYGDFILYSPPVEGKTLLVWVLPAIFLLLAIAVAVVVVRNATRHAESDSDEYLGDQPQD